MRTSGWLWLSGFVVLTLLGGLSTGRAAADVAPPEQPTGANLLPGAEPTQVRMSAEEVIIEVQPDTLPGKGDTWVVRDWAKVEAHFAMLNTGTQPEEMQVRFPLMNPAGWGDGFGNQPVLTDFSVSIEQMVVPFTVETTENPSGFDETPIQWAVFPATFMPGEYVNIVVNYTVQATGYTPFAEFGYILETGAGWRDTIGEGRVIVRLPYPASVENFLVGEANGTYTFSGRDAVFTFTDLEPDPNANIRVSVVAPEIWQAVLAAREQVASHPEDVEGWFSLAGSTRSSITYSKGWLREDAAGLALYQESLSAFAKAIALAPERFDGHHGLAQLLWSREAFGGQPNQENFRRMMLEYATAYAILPQDESLRQELDWIAQEYPEWIVSAAGGYSFPLIPTEEVAANLTPVSIPATPVSAVTPASAVTAAAGSAAKSTGGNGLACPASALPMAAVAAAGFARTRRKERK